MLKADAAPGGRHSRNEPAYPASSGGTGRSAGERSRILIVEDDYFVAIGLEQALVDAEFEVVGIAVTAEEAVALAGAKRPHLAVMDIRLAGARDGIDAAVALLSQYGIPSVFATAHGDEATRARGEKAQPLGWLTKPYSTQFAVQTISAILGR